MKTANGITSTTGRLEQSINQAVNRVAGPQITQQINEKVEDERIRTGVITKFYHYLDKAEVRLDNSDELVLCKILHRFGGDLIDLYTPLEEELTFCDTLKEPCVIPRSQLHVCVLNIHDADSEEQLILGFYQNEELVNLNPASPGNFKIVNRASENQFWIKFGADGLDLRLPSSPTTNIGEMDKDMGPIDYADSSNVYTKEEVYTKQEVDELISKAIAEALNGEDDTDDTTN